MKHPDPTCEPEELAAHLEHCAECSARIHFTRSPSIPAWARELDARRTGRLRWWQSTFWRFVLVALAAVLAALAVMAPALLPLLSKGRP